jgi:hypothetical protein
VKNMSRKFATMSDEERLRFAQEQGESAAGEENEEAADELELGDPRDQDRTEAGLENDKGGRAER